MKIICTICGEEIQEMGPLFLSSPESNGRLDVVVTKKYHLCRLCGDDIELEILKRSGRVWQI